MTPYRLLRIPSILLAILALCAVPSAPAAEETGYDYPLGPIGGTFRLWTSENFVRITELTPDAPGALAGLRVDDFIRGAFGREFDPLGSNFEGVVRQLGAAIDHAEANDGQLPLMILRPGTGTLTITIDLPVLGALDPAHPLTSAKYAAAYELACDELHQRVMNDSNGDIGYPTGFTGLTLLAHPNWNDTTGAKPYRLSVDKIRDYFIGRVNGAVYSPVEDLLLDHEINGTGEPSDNPNYVSNPVGLEAWSLGQAVMFLAEYHTKTGDASVFPVLQLGAELMANRVQWWKQPPKHENGYSPGWESRRGMTSHGGVTGDYTHLGWGGGINMAGVHLFCGLGLAKRAGVDMSVRPRDGHYFGYDLNPGDTIPPEIDTALPASIDLPHGCEDPDTGATTITDPFWYDMTLDQKFWLKWDFLIRSSGSDGHVNYAVSAGGTGDAGGRTPSALFGFLAYMGDDTLSTEDQVLVDRQKEYITLQHDRHLNAHAYNMGGSMFMALSLPYLDDRDQRYFLDNWKFYHNLSRQPDGSLEYVRGRSYGDAYQDYSLVTLLNTALPRSVALGGLPHIPGFDTERIFARFRQPMLEWPTPEARTLRTDSPVVAFAVDLLDAAGAVLDPATCTVTWSVVSGPVTTGIFADPSVPSATATFPQTGTYRIQLAASHNGLGTTEVIDVELLPDTSQLPADWIAGAANYEIFTGIAGSDVSDLTAAAKFPDAPDITRTLSTLEGDYSGNNYGSRLSGYLVAPATGNFLFHISSDDGSELRITPTPSTGDTAADEAGLTLVASVDGWTDPEEWDKFPSQQSSTIALTAGELYRFEALHKEGSGGDNLAVGWTRPGETVIEVIGASSLALPPVPSVPAAIVSQPVNQNVALGDTATFTIATEGPAPALYQWSLNGVAYWPPTTDPTLSIINVGPGHVGDYECVFTSPDGVLISQSATLTISDPDFGTEHTGGLWQEAYNDIDGSPVSDLTSDPKFPLFSDSSSVITSAETPSLGDDYGQRWTGWVVPTESTSYRFYVTSDDANELWLSTDDTTDQKVLISSRGGYRSSRAWQTVTPSDWIPLVAGQRYYLELLHKEGGGGDHCAIAWQKSGDPAPLNGDPPIDGAFLQYRIGGIAPEIVDPPFATWQVAEFGPDASNPLIAGENADPDMDLIPNLLEYALVLDPQSPDPKPIGSFVDLGGTPDWTVTFKQHSARTDVDFALEWCTTLAAGDWVPIARSLGGNPVEVLNGGTLVSASGSNPATIQIGVPTGGPRGFIRWVVTGH